MKFSIVCNLTIAGMLALRTVPSGVAAIAEDFGYGNLKVNGVPVTGRIPLLVALIDLATNSPNRQPLVTNAAAMYDQLVFNFFAVPSVTGYFLENSYGTFSWDRAGVIGPAVFDVNETATLDALRSDDGNRDTNGSPVLRPGLDGGKGFAYALERIAAKTGYNFAQWDANGDGTIEQQELSIVLIGNNGQRNAANRVIGEAGAGVAIPGQSVTLKGKIASVDHRASFLSLAHELSHSLGTVDIYSTNSASVGLSLMSSTIFPVDDERRSFHLDPWNKMRLGWLRPRIFAFNPGGVATISAAQISSPNTPVILYDPAKGTGEFFMIEFRNNQVAGAHHDIHISNIAAGPPVSATNGMAIWHIAGTNPPAYHEGATNLTAFGSALWSRQQTTPLLRWRDGSLTTTTVNPIAISPDGRDLTFEWITRSEPGSLPTCVKWVKRTDVGSYGQRMHHAMAFDTDRGVTVFFGGEIGKEDDRAYFDDTQEYDGTNWLQISVTGPKPPTRSMHAMAYDPVRKQIVLYGGHRADGPAFGDTWLYTSTGRGAGFWTNPPAGTGTITGHAMVWNPLRQKVMMQGGIDRVFDPAGGFHYFGGPVEWDGQTWNVNLPYTAPDEYGLAMAFDSSRNVTLAYGGFDFLNEGRTTDRFSEHISGTGWISRGTGPPRRGYAAMAYHERRQRVVLVGGVGDSPEIGEEAYEYIPERGFWFPIPNLPPGQGRAGAKMVYDSRRGVMVLTGGAGGGAPNAGDGGRYSDTWELWPGLTILAHPVDTTADVCGVATFGVNVEGVQPLRYVWRLDGQPLRNDEHFSGVDTPLLTITGLRQGHAGQYDCVISDSCGAQNPSAQNVVISRAAILTIKPTLEWVLRTTNGPPARFAHAMAYDSSRRVTVLFGGRPQWSALAPFNDLWEWDGAVWIQRVSHSISNGWTFAPGLGWLVANTNQPVRRANFAMAYDSRRGCVVLFGGTGVAPDNTVVALRDLWEWDGQNWRFRTAEGPIARFNCSMAYDDLRGRTVLFGGQPLPKPGEVSDAELVWEWDGERWYTNLPALNPSGANYGSQSRMTYDSFRQVTVFGPTYESYSHWSFWDWDGTQWTNTPVLHFTDPVVTVLHGTTSGGLSFDANRRRSIWFGGVQLDTVDRTALYDGKRWTLLTNTVAPPAVRAWPAMAYDSDRRVTVMFGGSTTFGGSAGATNDTWELVAPDLPMINGQPVSQYRRPGDNAVFSVDAVGPDEDDLHYQWYHGWEALSDSSRIAGAQLRTLIILGVGTQDAGDYYVRVSNACGEAITRRALLTLDPRLQIFSAANSFTLVWPPDANVVLEVADTPNGPWTVVPNPLIPFNIGFLGPSKFFRLRPL